MARFHFLCGCRQLEIKNDSWARCNHLSYFSGGLAAEIIKQLLGWRDGIMAMMSEYFCWLVIAPFT
ncbi:hypothetical protein KCP78_01395 [Salmonella enterica subsp. enterica]|nr:hypothetical protein KCP78_01395 [Salmonella enterica subsp. enterica]